MRMQYLGASVGAFALLVAAAPAMADCEVRDVRVVGDPQVRYDPFARDETLRTVRIQADVSKECVGGFLELAVIPEPDSLGAGGMMLARQGTEMVNVALALGSRDVPVSVLKSRAFDNDRAPKQRIETSGPVTLDGYSVYAPFGQVVSPGRYALRAQLLARVRKSGEVFEGEAADFRINVEVDASYRLAAGAGDRVLSLGELAPGVESTPASFSAYANVAYELIFATENSWRLMRDERGNVGSAGVPYTLRESGVEIARSTNRSSLNFAFPSGEGRRRHELTAVVQPYDRAAAGRYSDVITVEIRPRS